METGVVVASGMKTRESPARGTMNTAMNEPVVRPVAWVAGSKKPTICTSPVL